MALEALVGAAVEQAQGRQAGRDRQRVARQRARLVDVAGRGDPLHQLAAPGVGGRRQPAADDLAEDGQVGAYALALLGAAAATRKPEITSSNTSRAPVSSASSRRYARKPGSGGTSPMFAG